MNPEILTQLRAASGACANWSSLHVLAILGRAGTAGLTSFEIQCATGASHTTVCQAARKLQAAGLITAPQRGNGGRRTMFRWTIAPPGLAVLQAAPVAVPTMQPLPLSRAS